jgi:hypothetical protein
MNLHGPHQLVWQSIMTNFDSARALSNASASETPLKFTPWGYTGRLDNMPANTLTSKTILFFMLRSFNE